MVQNKSEESPPNNLQISKGNDRKRVSKIKRELFECMILFQLELSQDEKANT